MHLRSNRLIYQPTTPADLDFVTYLEGSEDHLNYICPSTVDQHRKFIENPDVYHLIVRKTDNTAIGFVFLSGLRSPNKSLELRRMIIIEKGMGYGREVLMTVKKLCFEELNFHRLWLDVFDYNHRAISLYQSEGLVEEGVLRECIYKDGIYRNLLLLSMLENEYVIP